MKKTNFVVIVLFMIVVFSSCTNSSTDADKESSDEVTSSSSIEKEVKGDPNQVGHLVYNILKGIDVESEDGEQKFIANFLSVEEMRAFGESEKVTSDKKIINDFASLKEEDWTKLLSTLYGSIKAMGEEKNIDWQNIEYKDYVYKVSDDDGGGKYVAGILAVQHNNKFHQFIVYSIWNGEEYLLYLFEKLV